MTDPFYIIDPKKPKNHEIKDLNIPVSGCSSLYSDIWLGQIQSNDNGDDESSYEDCDCPCCRNKIDW